MVKLSIKLNITRQRIETVKVMNLMKIEMKKKKQPLDLIIFILPEDAKTITPDGFGWLQA